MTVTSTTLLRHVRQLVGVHAFEQWTDRQLLERFVAGREEAAFTLLVRRHGPMVLGLCRRLLGHEQDAEDAFQAVFLLLARNAASIRQADMGGWLYRVAYHLAVRGSGRACKRRQRETQARPPSQVDPMQEATWNEVRHVVEEELQRLPEELRSALVLCHLEGRTQEEAAQLLCWSKGTLRRRLDRGRELLRGRLLRRGLGPMAALTAAVLVESSTAAVPSLLARAAVRAAVSGTSSPAVTALLQAGGAFLASSKARMATILLLAMSLLVGVGAWVCRGLVAARPAQPAEPPAAKADDKALSSSAKRESPNTVQVQGRVLDPDGKPKAGAKLVLLNEDGKTQPLGITAADGRFTVAVPQDPKSQYLVAQAEGTGLDFLGLPRGKSDKPIELRLVKDRPIRGRIVNTEGKPVAGVRVAVQSLNVYANGSVDRFLAEWKKRHFMSGVPGGDKSLWFHGGLFSPTRTDADGRFVLHGLGEERIVTLGTSGAGIAADELRVVNRGGFDAKPYNQATLDNIPKGREHLGMLWLLYGPEASVIVEAEKILRGTVKDADTGKGRPGVLVQLTRREGGNLLRLNPQARTDSQGRFEMHGARKAKRYMVEVAADTASGYLPCQVWADDTAGYDPLTMDVAVKKGVVITGRLLDGSNGKPIRGHVMIAVLQDNPFVKDYPSFSNSAWFPMQPTGADGKFRVIAIPGPVLLMGGPDDFLSQFHFKPPAADSKYPQYFDSRFPGFVAYYNPGGSMSPVQGNACKVLQIKPEAKRIEQDIVLERASVLPVRVQDADGKPLAGCYVGGTAPRDFYSGIHCPESDCPVYGLEPGKPRLLVVFHPQRKIAGTLTLKGDEKAPPVVKLGPTGALKGRLLDGDGQPLAGVIVDVNYRQRAVSEVDHAVHNARHIETDAEGRFTLEELMPGQKFELAFRSGKRKFERTPKPADPAIEVKAGECRELDAIQLLRVQEKTGE